jgi:hypothetical protein
MPLAQAALTESALADSGSSGPLNPLLISTLRFRTFTSLPGLKMPQGRDFGTMGVGETVTGSIDFGNWLDAGVTIASIVSVIASNFFPSASGSAYVNLTGSAAIGTVPTSGGGSGVTNAAILQQWTGANPGTARITITIITSDGQTLIGWAHQPVGSPN